MRAKPLWIFIAFLVWGAGSTYWYVCQIKGFCTESPAKVVSTPEKSLPEKEQIQASKPEALHDLLYYKKNETQPVINDDKQWSAEVKSIAQLKAEGKKLKIEAPYYADENNNTSFDNLGIARAEAVKKMFSKVLDTSMIITGSKLIDSQNAPDYIDGFKDYVHWINDNSFVKEKQKKTLIYFPVNSNKEINNKSIDNYLNELVDKVKKNPDLKIQITGHTDNTGSQKRNYRLGLLRAKRIQQILATKGIPNNRIVVKSEGENKPIADNKTAEGRQKNRRVEIEIIQN